MRDPTLSLVPVLAASFHVAGTPDDSTVRFDVRALLTLLGWHGRSTPEDLASGMQRVVRGLSAAARLKFSYRPQDVMERGGQFSTYNTDPETGFRLPDEWPDGLEHFSLVQSWTTTDASGAQCDAVAAARKGGQISIALTASFVATLRMPNACPPFNLALFLDLERPVARALYRALVGLRAQRRWTVSVAELLARVGSTSRDPSPRGFKRALGGALQELKGDPPAPMGDERRILWRDPEFLRGARGATGTGQTEWTVMLTFAGPGGARPTRAERELVHTLRSNGMQRGVARVLVEWSPGRAQRALRCYARAHMEMLGGEHTHINNPGGYIVARFDRDVRQFGPPLRGEYMAAEDEETGLDRLDESEWPTGFGSDPTGWPDDA